MTRFIASAMLVLITTAGGLLATTRPAQAKCSEDYYVCLNDHVYTAKSEAEADYWSVRCAASYYRCMLRKL